MVFPGCTRHRRGDPYDVVADAFERFVRRVCRDARHPVAFLYRVAINRATDLARRRAVREPAPPADPETVAAEQRV